MHQNGLLELIFLLMEVIQRSNCRIIRFINSFFSSNTYFIILNNRECWMIDCGDFTPLQKYINSNNLILKGVLLTHTHYDHIYGLNNLVDTYRNINIYTNDFGQKALVSNKLNLSKYHNENFKLQGGNIIEVFHNDKIRLNETTNIVFYFVPGHDKSSIMFEIGDCYFTGDAYIPGKRTILAFPNSNKVDQKKSAIFIENKIRYANIFAGHGSVVLVN